jgi:transcription elongation factor GreA
MTAVSASQRTKDLTERLAALRAERERLLAELLPPSYGDDADRATNVNGHIQVAALDERIAAVESALTNLSSASHAAAGTVGVGSVVGLDFGEGTETFLLSPVDAIDPDQAVVTPDSPLGRALLGAAVGAQISYEPRPGRQVRVTVTKVG